MESTNWYLEWNFDSLSNLPVLIRQVLCEVCLGVNISIMFYFQKTSVLIMISKVICKMDLSVMKMWKLSGNFQFSSMKYYRKITLPDSNICECNSEYVTSELSDRSSC